MNKFLAFISHGLHQIQRTFFPDLEHEVGPIPETLVGLSYIWTGRPPKSRRGILNAFISKSFLGLPTTFHIIERLHSDRHLRLICGFETRKHIPSESVFSRVFAKFAETALPQQIHEALIKRSCSGTISGHLSRDSTIGSQPMQSVIMNARQQNGRMRD